MTCGFCCTSSGVPSAIFLAEIQYADRIGNIHDNAHVVLDHDDRDPAFLIGVKDEAGHILFFLQVHAGHRLVQKQDLWFKRQRPGQFDPFLETVGQGPDDLLADALNEKEIR